MPATVAFHLGSEESSGESAAPRFRGTAFARRPAVASLLMPAGETEERRAPWTMAVLPAAMLLGFAAATTLQFMSRRRAAERAPGEQELRRLSRRLVQAQEDERRSISRELHDEVGQMLTALQLELGTLGRIPTEAQQDFQAHLEDARRLAQQTLRAVRDLAMGLRPSILDDLGLAPALDWQARAFSRHSGVPVSVDVEGELERLPDSHRICVYRVVQEALTNCARHAHATRIAVTVRVGRQSVETRIEDDGVGFEGAGGSGLGLVGIRERVREAGGSVAIVSQRGKGTVLRVDLPLAAAG